MAKRNLREKRLIICIRKFTKRDKDETGNNIGWFYYDRNGNARLDVDQELPQGSLIITLYHEFTHFIINEFMRRLDDAHNTSKVMTVTVSDVDEERLCYAVERAVKKAFRDRFGKNIF